MQAKTLPDALNNFRELVPLTWDPAEQKQLGAGSSPDFYIERPDNPLDQLKTFIINSRGREKVVLTGHMGSGKSTELNKLVADEDVKKKFFIIKYSAKDVLNITEIDYLEFLLSFLSLLLVEFLERAAVELNATILQKIAKWINTQEGFRDVIQETEEARPSKGPLKKFFQVLSQILKNEVTRRKELRDIVNKNINSLLTVINISIEGINTALNAKGLELLVVVDDLDKVFEVKRANDLFIEAGTYMTSPQCKIIYTAPIALYYSINFSQIMQRFDKSYFVRNIKVLNADGSSNDDGIKIMLDFIEKRIAWSLIDTAAAEEAAKFSGGVVRQLVRILDDSINKALTKKHPTITRDVIQTSISTLRNEYDRGLRAQHYQVMREILEGNESREQETLFELYHNRVLLEFENANRWTIINPLVQKLYDNQAKRVIAK